MRLISMVDLASFPGRSSRPSVQLETDRPGNEAMVDLDTAKQK